jgi:transposase InsO family protein
VVYFAAVLDLFSRKIVGWAAAPNMPASLVCELLNMALNQRRPPPGLIVHSDRGSQYASHDYRQLLQRHALVGFYNSRRLHSTLGNLPPNAFERNQADKQPISVSIKT